MRDHQDINCPYLREIASLQERIPDNFPEKWGKLSEKVEQIHTALFKDGYSKRIRDAELNIVKLAVTSGLIWTVVTTILGWVIYNGR